MIRRTWAIEALVVVLAVAEVLATRGWLEDWMTAGALVVAGALVLRRRFPRTVLALALATLATGVLWLPALCALHALAASERRRGEVVAGSAAVAVVAFVPWRDLDGYVWSLPDATLASLLAGLLAVAPAALGLLGRARTELAARLAELALSRERERRYAAEQAALRERERLARDLHDTAAHHLSLISLRAGAMAATADSAPYREEAAALGELGRRAAADLRRAIRHDGPGLDRLPELLEAAADIVDSVHLEPGDCPPAVQHTAYRIVQEALTNIRRHAPGASAEVSVHRAGGALRITVRNTTSPGPSTVPDQGGHGLPGLRTRAAALGGTLTATPTPEGGFTVEATLPVPAATAPPVAST
ncbi:histidine kinase [Streptomyces sp. NPDC006283]|uniref:sensor histidine kinase n=1 Tax=Streptomyces sp. NPDC006283 TaxID=3156741 RepID=UPI0033AD0487